MRAVWNATFDGFGDCEQVATNNFGASAAGGWPTASRSAGSTSDLIAAHLRSGGSFLEEQTRRTP